MQLRARRFARALREDTLTDPERNELTAWLNAMTGEQRWNRRTANPRLVALFNALLVELGGRPEAPSPRSNKSRYPAIAYHWLICREMGKPRSYVADLWAVDAKSVSTALAQNKRSVEVELDARVYDGERRGFSKYEVLAGEERLVRPRRRR